MAETADLRAVVQIGQQYVAICDQFLGENLGRPYTVPELSQFAETAISTLMASAYSNFRDVLGKEAAEAWLKKTLSMAASTIRLLGADALLRFEVHIKDMPNNLHQKRQEMEANPAAAPAAAPEAPKCACVLNSDGSCPTCLEMAMSYHKTTFVFMGKMKEQTDKCQEICQVCMASQTDLAISKSIPEALACGIPKEENQLLNFIRGFAQQFGAKAIPITEKALKDAVKA